MFSLILSISLILIFDKTIECKDCDIMKDTEFVNYYNTIKGYADNRCANGNYYYILLKTNIQY